MVGHQATAAGLSAIIYILDSPETKRWAKVCMAWVTEHGYELVSVVVDDTPNGEKWASVVQMLADDEAQVCVVPRWDQMPPDRIPRVEVIAEDLARDDFAPPRQRRPRRSQPPEK